MCGRGCKRHKNFIILGYKYRFIIFRFFLISYLCSKHAVFLNIVSAYFTHLASGFCAWLPLEFTDFNDEHARHKARKPWRSEINRSTQRTDIIHIRTGQTSIYPSPHVRLFPLFLILGESSIGGYRSRINENTARMHDCEQRYYITKIGLSVAIETADRFASLASFGS